VSTIFGSAAVRRAVPVLTFVLGLVALGINLAQVPLDSLTHQTGTGGPLADTLSVVGTTVPVAVVGTLLAIRRPRNPIGWLLLGLLVSSAPTNQYLILDYRMHHGALPLGWLAVVLLETWPLLLVFLALLLWLFPDGTLPTGRWRRPAAILVAGGLLLGAAGSTSGLIAVAEHRVRIKPDGDLLSPPLGGLAAAVIVPVLVSLVAWLVFQFPTYRRAGGERRQQLKWLYFGAAITSIAFIIGAFVEPLAQGNTLGYGTQPVVNAVTNVAYAALPICLGVAIFRYRLYELNRIISRVVSYVLITGLLAGVFFGLVLLATHVLPFRTTVGVAVSTLVIAALFNPLRRRVQNLVDRRFNRSRYDAEAIVAAFNARLRQTVDLDTVRYDLLGVTANAFQPTHVSVWIAPADGEQRPAVVAGLPHRQGLTRNAGAPTAPARPGWDHRSRRWPICGSRWSGGRSAASGSTRRRRRAGRARTCRPGRTCSRRSGTSWC
jgi:hypothetical protein